RLETLLSSRLFVRNLADTSRQAAIANLAQVAAAVLPIGRDVIEAAAWRREQTMPTGIGNGVALPHARLDGLSQPVVVVGLSEAGIDFDAPDGALAHVIFLILTPGEETTVQLELAAEIGRLFGHHEMLNRALRTRNYSEFLAVIRSVPRDAL